MVCLLDYFLRLWFFRLSSGFSVLVFGVALWLCDGVWWWWLVLVGFFACWKWPLLLVVVGRFFGFGCNTQQSNVSSMWPIHIIQCFFSRNCVAASFFDSHSVWLVSDVCMCLVHIRFYICVGHLFGIGHIKLKWLGLEGWPLENQNRRRFICQSSFNDLSGIFIACKFATIHQYLCGFRRIL